MQRALALARRGSGMVSPNPLVGAVIVRKGEKLGEGYHRRFGGAHAEIEALQQVSNARKATLYVTLEPCAHFGKTPPCTSAVLESGIQRVVCAVKDPNPLVAGKGLARLRKGGLKVVCGVLEEEARVLNDPFFKFHQIGMPLVTAKWAMTLDGKIATRTGDSCWISSETSRKRVHALRRRVDAIMIGSGTALADDPLLTPRPALARKPLRVVLDSRARISLSSKLVRTARQFPLFVCTTRSASRSRTKALKDAGVDVRGFPVAKKGVIRIEKVLEYLAQQGRYWVLAEGGGRLFGSLFDGGLVDRVQVYMGPKISGGHAPSPVLGMGVDQMANASELVCPRISRIGCDVLVEGALQGS